MLMCRRPNPTSKQPIGPIRRNGVEPMRRADFIALMKAQKGKKYILGTPVPHDAPNPPAFDCSGLVIWGFNKAGCQHPDTTANGLYHESRSVASYATGDMVFLVDSKDHAYHTAMLLYPTASGDWAIIEAKGKKFGVVLTTLSYWRKRKGFKGPRRWSGFKLESDQIKFAIVHASQKNRRFGGLPSDSAFRASGIDKLFTDDYPCSIITLTETDLTMRRAINAALGKHWTRFAQSPSKTVAMFVNTNIWEPRGVRTSVDYGDKYHGAVMAILRHRASNVEVAVIAHHGREAETADSHPDLSLALSLSPSTGRCILSGDHALKVEDVPRIGGFTLDSDHRIYTYKSHTPDGIYSREMAGPVNRKTISQPWSDHFAVRVVYVLP